VGTRDTSEERRQNAEEYLGTYNSTTGNDRKLDFSFENRKRDTSVIIRDR